MHFTTPDWVKQAIFYQIFPDRFAQSERTFHPKGLQFKPWGAPPEEQGFQGGDLYGVAEKLDYLKDLGVNALYLNPIFTSACNHRYHTFDYMTVDPLLGGNDALRHLLDEAHSRDMKVVLDGVFNHASRGFWAFHHILENGSESPYVDWFHIDGYPLNPYPRNAEEETNYQSWWNLPALPKFNTDNPGVREYLFEVAEFWIKFGIDGWRLDVPYEIDDDGFWREFRQRVKGINPEAYICGEIWEDAERWLAGDQFDATMNYQFTGAVLSWFGHTHRRDDYDKEPLNLARDGAEQFSHRINHVVSLYPEEVSRVQLNLLDSHDTTRALWVMGDNLNALKQAYLFTVCVPGVPCIYYGSEIGMSSGDDPHCREAYPWQSTESHNHELLDFYRKANHLRHEFPVLRQGQFELSVVNDDLVRVDVRSDEQHLVAWFNRSDKSFELQDLEQMSVQGYRRVLAAKEENTIKNISGENCIVYVS